MTSIEELRQQLVNDAREIECDRAVRMLRDMAADKRALIAGTIASPEAAIALDHAADLIESGHHRRRAR